MDAIIEQSGTRWIVTPLTDDGFRIPERAEIFETEAEADAARAALVGDDDSDE